MGGAIDGNCDTGSVFIASNPISTITSDNTIASTGLCMNLLNIVEF
jgi:hypothetical protein